MVVVLCKTVTAHEQRVNQHSGVAFLALGFSMGAIRLFLAIAVLLEHFDHRVLSERSLPFDVAALGNINGARAVLLFYVISGFLISFALHEKYSSDRSGTLAFYHARFLRIYPLWWAVLIFSVAVMLFKGPTSLSNYFPAVMLFGLDWIIPLRLYPQFDWSVLPPGTGIAWTLGAELTFYLVAPWLLRHNTAALAVLIGSALVRTIAHARMSVDDLGYNNLTFFFFPATVMFFLLGHFAAVVSRRYLLGRSASIALLVSSITLFGQVYPRISIDSWSDYLASACFAMALPGIFAGTKDNRLSNYLGDLTYPLYLTHTLTIAVLFGSSTLDVGRLMDKLLLPSITTKSTVTLILISLIVAASILAAVLSHVLIEKPVKQIIVLATSSQFVRALQRKI
jgi:peptidoglycan/LPS O-acetylase OafA/YrhL